MTTQHSRPSGRESRPRVPRGSLSRDRIVEAALEVLDRDGAQGLTMPGVAARLGVGTMSLYRHVRNKADLIQAVTGRVFRDLDLPPGEDWRVRLTAYLIEWRRLALAHPGLAGIVADPLVAAAQLERHLEAAAPALCDAGFTREEAARTLFTVFAFVFGYVTWEMPGRGYSGTSAPVASGEQFEAGLAGILGCIGPGGIQVP